MCYIKNTRKTLWRTDFSRAQNVPPLPLSPPTGYSIDTTVEYAHSVLVC